MTLKRGTKIEFTLFKATVALNTTVVFKWDHKIPELKILMQKTRLPICQLVLQAMAGDNLNFYTGSGSMVLYIAKAL